MRSLLAPALLLLLLALPAFAQEPVPADAYGDAGARELVRLARERRAMVDTRISAYEVTAHERMSAHLAVMGIERLLFRRETVARIDWTRDTVRIEVLGAREALPLVSSRAQLPPPSIAGTVPSLAFDPVDSEMLFRLDSTAVRHPLAPGSESLYRFASGDVTSIRLPGGREVRLLELRIAARRPDPRLINGSFWMDAETHAVVRAVFRLSRNYSTSDAGVSVLTPEVTGEVDHVVIDYGLWDLRWWLPRTVVARGVVRMMGARLPLAYERRYEGYRVEGDTAAATVPTEAAPDRPAGRPCRPRTFGSVTIGTGAPADSATRDSLWNAAWDRSVERLTEPDTAESAQPCDRAFLVTRREEVDLAESPVFTESAFGGEGPVTEAELRELAGMLRGLPESPWSLGRPSVTLLSPDLVRFNRVEGLSLGAGAVLPLGPAELRGELRVGTTGEVGARLSAVRSAPSLRTEAAAYRRVEAVEVASQPFSLPGSASALLLGRDENDYFRGTGAEMRLSPPAARRQSWELRLFGERQQPVSARSGLSLRGLLDDDFEVRANLAAERLDQVGATLRMRGALGTDPARRRSRAELELHGEAGDRTFARPRLRLEADVPLGPGMAFGVAVAAGTGFGDLPPQRAWQIGGATSVRGHDPAALRGESFWLARAELARGNPAFRLGVFGDVGWAGDRGELQDARPLRGVGIGASFLGGLLRLDLARGIGGGGLRLHLRLGGAL